MQKELPGVDIQILGINLVGSESGNPEMCAGRELPWLQDTVDEHVWSQWRVTYRDVVILGRNNAFASVYNLTDNDLAVPANYAALKDLLLATAND